MNKTVSCLVSLLLLPLVCQAQAMETNSWTSAPIEKLIYSLKSLTRISRVGYLASDRRDSHKTAQYYRQEMREDFVERYVRNFDQWLEQYAAMQNQVDVILIGSIKGIRGWNHEKAMDLIMEKTTIPTGSLENGMAVYSCLGLDDNGMVVNLKTARSAGIKIPRSVVLQASRLIFEPNNPN